MSTKKSLRLTPRTEQLETRTLLSGDGLDLADQILSAEVVCNYSALRLEPVQAGAGPELDVHPDVFDETATLLQFDGLPRSSYLDSATDVDVFRFIAENDNIAFLAASEIPLAATLFNASGTMVGGPEQFDAFLLNLPGQNQASFTAAETVPGETYYITIASPAMEEGAFDLHAFSLILDPTNDALTDAHLGEDIHGGSIETASALRIDQETPTAAIYSNIDSEVDIDMFSVASSANTFYVKATSANLSLEVQVLDDAGRLVHTLSQRESQIDATRVDGFFSVADPGQEFYISVSGSGGTGAYELSVLGVLPLPDRNSDPEPNPSVDIGGSIADAGSVELGHITNSDIGFAGDVDMFRLLVGKTGDLSLFCSTAERPDQPRST